MSDQISESREAAEGRSRHCQYCSGAGLVTLYHPAYRGSKTIEIEAVDRDGEVKQMTVPARVAGHCGCPLGRWMRSKIDLDTLRRIPDLLDVLAGRSRWLWEDPCGDVPCNGRVPSLEQLERMKATVGVNVGSKGRR